MSKTSEWSLCIRNLPKSATARDVEGHFGGVGPIRRCFIVTDSETGESRGTAFVTYSLREHTSAAVEALNHSTMWGCRIDVEHARHRKRETASGALARRHERKQNKRAEKEAESGDAQVDGDDSQSPVASAGANPKYDADKIRRSGVPKRTVVLTKGGGGGLDGDASSLGEEMGEKLFLENGVPAPVGIVPCADGRELRCTFSDLKTARKAAVSVHGRDSWSAVIDAFRTGGRTRVIVRNLPFSVKENELRGTFEKVMPVRAIHFPQGKRNSGAELGTVSKSGWVKTSGYVFVEFFTPADKNEAIKRLNGQSMCGRTVAVDAAFGKSEYEKKKDLDADAPEEQADTEKVVGGGEVQKCRKKKANEGQPGTEDKSGSDDKKDSDDNNDEHEDGTPSDVEDLEMTVDHKSHVKDEEKKHRDGKCSKAVKSASSTNDEMERTVFVRNLPFTVNATELWRFMEEKVGKVEQAVLVKNQAGRPRGSAFVRYATREDAAIAAERNGTGRKGCENKLELFGRELIISKAVRRDAVIEFGRKEDGKEVVHDPRNMRLAVLPWHEDSVKMKGVPEQYVKSRRASEKKRMDRLKDKKLYVSTVRLCVRNLPRQCDAKFLEVMSALAAQGKLGGGAGNGGKGIEKEQGTAGKATIVHCAIAKDETNNRSKGFGFVEFEKHEDALRAVGGLDNNERVLEWVLRCRPKALKLDGVKERLLRAAWGARRRLTVEFAVQDSKTVRYLQSVKDKGRKLREEKARRMAEEERGRQEGVEGENEESLGDGVEEREGMGEESEEDEEEDEGQGEGQEGRDVREGGEEGDWEVDEEEGDEADEEGNVGSGAGEELMGGTNGEGGLDGDGMMGGGDQGRKRKGRASKKASRRKRQKRRG